MLACKRRHWLLNWNVPPKNTHRSWDVPTKNTQRTPEVEQLKALQSLKQVKKLATLMCIGDWWLIKKKKYIAVGGSKLQLEWFFFTKLNLLDTVQHVLHSM